MQYEVFCRFPRRLDFVSREPAVFQQAAPERSSSGRAWRREFGGEIGVERWRKNWCWVCRLALTGILELRFPFII